MANDYMDGGALTQEELYKLMLEAQLNAGNIGSQQKEADRSDLYAQQLRKGSPTGNRTAENLARAFNGTMAGYEEGKAMKGRKEAGAAQLGFFNDMKNRMNVGRGGPQMSMTPGMGADPVAALSEQLRRKKDEEDFMPQGADFGNPQWGGY